MHAQQDSQTLAAMLSGRNSSERDSHDTAKRVYIFSVRKGGGLACRCSKAPSMSAQRGTSITAQQQRTGVCGEDAVLGHSAAAFLSMLELLAAVVPRRRQRLQLRMHRHEPGRVVVRGGAPVRHHWSYTRQHAHLVLEACASARLSVCSDDLRSSSTPSLYCRHRHQHVHAGQLLVPSAGSPPSTPRSPPPSRRRSRSPRPQIPA